MDICNSLYIKLGVYTEPPFVDPLGAITVTHPPIVPLSSIESPSPRREAQLDLESAAIGTVLATSPLLNVSNNHIFDDRVINNDPARLNHHYEILDDEESALSNIQEFLYRPKTNSDASFDTGEVHTLGLTNILFLPIKWLEYIRFLYKSIKTGDTEGIIEYGIKVFSVPFALANAYEGLFIGYVVFKGVDITTFILTSIIFGSIFLTIELCLEIARLVRTIQFRNAIEPALALNLLQHLDLSKIKNASDLRHFIDSLRCVKESFSHFMPNSESEKRLNSILEILESDKEMPEKVSLASNKVEELKLRLVTSALSSIHESYLFLSEKELEACDAKAIQNSGFSRTQSDFEETSEELNQNEQEKFDRYQKAFTAERTLLLEGKRSALGRRVRLKMVNKLESTLPNLFANYRWYIEGDSQTSMSNRLEGREIIIENATNLLKNLDDQSEKTILVHVIGIAGILLGIGSFLATTIACPPAVLAIVSLLGFVLATYRSSAPKAFLDSDGYKWNFDAMLPDFLKKNNPKSNTHHIEKELKPLIFDRESNKHVGIIGRSSIPRKKD